MKRLALITTTFAAAASFTVMASPTFSNPASNQPICGARDTIVQSLSDQFNERPQAVGVVDKDAVMEIFVSETGSWTIIATGTDGNSCLVSSGEGWESKSMVIGVDA